MIVRGRGAVVWDEDGREYIDARAGLWYCGVGHGRAEIADAVAAQMRELAAYDTFDRLANRPALELADRVSALAPIDRRGRVLHSAAARTRSTPRPSSPAATGTRSGSPTSSLIVHRQHAYHGMNAYGTSLAGIPTNREGFGDADPRRRAACRTTTRRRSAALFDERAERDRGLHRRAGDRRRRDPAPARGLLAGACRSCAAAHDVLLIADEVITGFGRLGRWFGCQRLGIDPDMITCAKAITSGYLPLGAVIVRPARPGAVLDRARPRDLPPRLHVLGPPRSLRRRPRQPRPDRA